VTQIKDIHVFISNAYAAGGAASPDLMSFLPLVVIFVLFWFMLIRPQMKQAKEQRRMIEALQKNDEVIIASGLAGKVIKVGDTFVSVEVAPEVVVQVQKSTIQTLLPKGTLKAL
jgi:preprotein translocase subunit YajC